MDKHLDIRGTFSSSLRDRSVWKILEPILAASLVNLEESESQGHDFSFQQTQQSQTQSLQVILLTPNSLELSNKQGTISQLKIFDSFTTPPCSSKAIAFIISEDAFRSASGKYNLDGLLTLQVFLFEHLPSPIPVIPIPDSSSFLSCIQEYMRSLEDIPLAGPSLTDSLTLLANANSDFPMSFSQQETNILSDLVPSLRILSQSTRTQKGRELLKDSLGGEQMRKIWEFWSTDISRE